MPFLFDTDAISEVLRKRPAASYLQWLARIPPAQQFTSAVVVGELYKGAFRSSDSERIPGIRLHRALAEARQAPS